MHLTDAELFKIGVAWFEKLSLEETSPDPYLTGAWILIDESKDEWAFYVQEHNWSALRLTSFRRHGEPTEKVIR